MKKCETYGTEHLLSTLCSLPVFFSKERAHAEMFMDFTVDSITLHAALVLQALDIYVDALDYIIAVKL